MKAINRNQRGVTLIEVLVAIFLISVGLWGIVGIFPMATKTAKLANSSTVAVNLARAQMEQLLSLDYTDLTTGTIEAKHRLSASPDEQLYNYQRQSDVVYVNSELNEEASDQGMKKITVTVYWYTSLDTTAERNISLVNLVVEK